MKKHLILFSFALIIALVFNACEDDTTGPGPTVVVGSLNIQSTPTGATVFIDNVNRGTTNTKVTNVTVGTRTVRLELDGYRDTTFTVVIEENMETLKQVTLTEVPPTLTPYGPVKIYETTGTTALQPSGLDLSTGSALSLSNNANDLFYFTNSTFTIHELRSANRATGLTRSTSFFVGSGTNLNDGTDSPLATSSWLDDVLDTESNYFFTFDSDLHYSKVRIVNSGGGSGPGDPAWVELQWLYNETPNDTRF